MMKPDSAPAAAVHQFTTREELDPPLPALVARRGRGAFVAYTRREVASAWTLRGERASTQEAAAVAGSAVMVHDARREFARGAVPWKAHQDRKTIVPRPAVTSGARADVRPLIPSPA
jgi:hypothetical protein